MVPYLLFSRQNVYARCEFEGGKCVGDLSIVAHILTGYMMF